MIFENIELVVTLCKLAASPQGNKVQQETKGKDDGKNQPLFGELDEQASLEAQASFEKATRLTIGKVKHEGWQHHFVFYLG